MRIMERACRESTGSSNVWESGGKRYFWETSRREHADGAVTGSVWMFTDADHARRAGTFRIEGNGDARLPPTLKALMAKLPREYWSPTRRREWDSRPGA